VVKTGTAVKLVNREQNSLVLADNTVLTYDYLLGCDGVYSAVAKSLYGNSYPIKQTLFCLETVLPIAVYPSQITEPEIHFGYVRWGYVWVFPKGDNLTVGLGGIPRHNDNLTKLFRAFIQDRFGDIQDYRIQGHHLPFGAFRPVPGLGNILLCGDAAGFVDPITGEGIAYALESGHLAAQAIIEKQSNHYSDPVGKIYCKSCLPIQQAISQANKLKWLIFPKISEKLFIKALTRSSRIPKRYIDLFSGELSYLEFTDFLKRKAGEAIRHKLRM
jgi:flavin-dependent dehydrogenase